MKPTIIKAEDLQPGDNIFMGDGFYPATPENPYPDRGGNCTIRYTYKTGEFGLEREATITIPMSRLLLIARPEKTFTEEMLEKSP